MDATGKASFLDDASGAELPSTSPVRHPEYYLEDGNVVIQVDELLFHVHRSTFIRHSTVFADIFSLPVSANPELVEGFSDEYPLRFPGICSTDFERLMWILYPTKLGVYKARTAGEWESVLHLATRWEFDDVRALAIRHLETLPMSPVDRIVLSRKFDIRSNWALSAYTELCERAEPLSMDEGHALGLDTTIRVSQLREKLRCGRRPMRQSSLPHRIGTTPLMRSSSLISDSGKITSRKEAHSALRSESPFRRVSRAPRVSEASRLASETFGLSALDSAPR
ncbi:hypothetical protein SERLA73DRAFT_190621 [Serpula lacrymans var. lacrymans S7.3]|uniref:BTB domain-containing protein n=2 Tax=Serpula lacrymans var. lacrymans TaxID=341189 RepID=F8QG20_SERL3|nr:uncharacterized protein SERLADRAFT_463490 [Serpula lacrymans var. lacrymans S7.9]EGN92768.1 hypothetical protein SERLA73DRAFT_190621 [Serpula lacrymans var. lacrymans S7.3]EGO26429.1 hypothetical protein SERLADRAFT_463490 [Serpula lacrymans var. lacrymans S7.9]